MFGIEIAKSVFSKTEKPALTIEQQYLSWDKYQKIDYVSSMLDETLVILDMVVSDNEISSNDRIKLSLQLESIMDKLQNELDTLRFGNVKPTYHNPVKKTMKYRAFYSAKIKRNRVKAVKPNNRKRAA